MSVVIYLDLSASLQFNLRQVHLVKYIRLRRGARLIPFFWNIVCSDAIRLTFPCPFGATTAFQSRHKVTRYEVGR